MLPTGAEFGAVNSPKPRHRVQRVERIDSGKRQRGGSFPGSLTLHFQPPAVTGNNPSPSGACSQQDSLFLPPFPASVPFLRCTARWGSIHRISCALRDTQSTFGKSLGISPASAAEEMPKQPGIVSWNSPGILGIQHNFLLTFSCLRAPVHSRCRWALSPPPPPVPLGSLRSCSLDLDVLP